MYVTRHLGSQGGKFIHTVGVYINRLQVAHGQTCFFTARILGGYTLISFDGFVVVSVLVVQKTDFGGCLTAYRTFGIFLQQFAKRGNGTSAIVALYIRTAFLVKRIDIIGRVGIFAGQPVEQRHFFVVIFLESGHQSQLVEGVVARSGSHLFGPGVELFGGIEAAHVQVAIAYAVAGIGKNGRVPVSTQLQEAAEIILGRSIIFLMECNVSQVVVGQCIHFAFALGGTAQIVVKASCGFRYFTLSVKRFAFPVLCLVQNVLVLYAGQ